MTDSPQKQSIADAFKRHFQHFGFKKTTVDEIAHELQISKKTIYQHFNTKEEIFYFVVSQVARQYLRKMVNELAGDPTASQKLSHLVRMIFDETRKWLSDNDAFEFRYKYEIAELAFKDAYSELIQRLLKEGITSGEFRPVPVDLTVLMIQGMFSESMRLVSADPQRDIEEHLIEAILKIVQ